MWIVRRVLAPRVNFFTTLDENEIGLGCHAKADGVLVGKVIFLLFRARLVHPMEKKETCSSGFVIEALCVVLAVICVVTDGVFTAKSIAGVTCNADSSFCEIKWYWQEMYITIPANILIFGLLTFRYVVPLSQSLSKFRNLEQSEKKRVLMNRAAALCVLGQASKVACNFVVAYEGAYGLLMVALDSAIQGFVVTEMVSPYRKAFLLDKIDDEFDSRRRTAVRTNSKPGEASQGSTFATSNQSAAASELSVSSSTRIRDAKKIDVGEGRKQDGCDVTEETA